MEKGGRFARDPVDYQFTVFGTPGAKDAWGWRVILTMNKLDISPLSPAGLAGSAMTTDQRAALTRLIEAYATMVADDLAADRLAKVKATGPDQVTFAWAGPVEKGAKHYYRVQGPGFLIEYDNTQNDGNHIHAVWRDFQGDFGRDLLREHWKEYAHE